MRSRRRTPARTSFTRVSVSSSIVGLPPHDRRRTSPGTGQPARSANELEAGRPERVTAAGNRADSTSSAPDAHGPVRMPRRVPSYEDRQPAVHDPVTRSVAERGIVRLDLAVRARGYVWTIGGQAFPDAAPTRVRRAWHVRFAAGCSRSCRARVYPRRTTRVVVGCRSASCMAGARSVRRGSAGRG